MKNIFSPHTYSGKTSRYNMMFSLHHDGGKKEKSEVGDVRCEGGKRRV